MLLEGEIYNFLVCKTTVFPDGEEYYVLESPFKTKHLLSKRTYFHYNFCLNNEIKCKVDRINCSLRIFLEPEHPVYKINGVYEMNFIRQDNTINSKGVKKDTIILKDMAGIEYVCIDNSNFSDFSVLSIVKFKLLRIKKAIFYIQII